MLASLALALLAACAQSRSALADGSVPLDPKPSVAGRGEPDADGDAVDAKERAPSKLDPAHVHFVVSASLRPGTIWREAGVVRLDAPTTVLAGFPGDGSNWYSLALVAPEGRLLYNKSELTGTADGKWFEWRADATWSRSTDYPSKPEGNDPRIETPGCDDTRFGGVLPRPEGGYLYWCYGGVFEADGRQIADADFVKATGPYALTHRNVLLGRSGVTRVLADLDSSSTREIQGLPDVDWSIFAARAVPDGFMVAGAPGTWRGDNEAWHIGFDAVATRIGTYPTLSDFESVVGKLALDRDGALYSRTEREVTRRTIDGTSEVVYELARDAPFVAEAQGYVAGMFTGP